MTTNQKVWSKVVLSSYNYLERLCESIDELVESTALNSFYCYGLEDSVMALSNKIIKLSNRKINYINLKLVVEKTLKDIPNNLSKLLILKYVHNFSIEKCCDLLGYSLRTGYRKLDTALATFSEKMSILGYNVCKLEKDFLNDEFFYSAYKIVDKEKFLSEEKAETLTNNTLFTGFMKEFFMKASI